MVTVGMGLPFLQRYSLPGAGREDGLADEQQTPALRGERRPEPHRAVPAQVELVIVRNTGTIILSAYIAVLMAALLLGPLIVLHGYRAWWLVTFYAVLASAAIGGSISRYRMVRRNRKS